MAAIVYQQKPLPNSYAQPIPYYNYARMALYYVHTTAN